MTWAALHAEVALELATLPVWEAMALHCTGYTRSQRTRADALRPRQRTRIRQLHGLGWSAVRIAHRLGLHRLTVTAVLRERA